MTPSDTLILRLLILIAVVEIGLAAIDSLVCLPYGWICSVEKQSRIALRIDWKPV